METSIVSWGYVGILEKKMETTIESLGFRVLCPYELYGFRVEGRCRD